MVPAMDHMDDPQRPIASTFAIREARDGDRPRIWPIIHDVITEQQTFPYDPAMSEDDAKQVWLLTAPARVVVAADDHLILGTANMYDLRPYCHLHGNRAVSPIGYDPTSPGRA